MSFDLYFYTEGAAPSQEDLRAALRATPRLVADDATTPFEFTYLNEDTGVYAQFKLAGAVDPSDPTDDVEPTDDGIGLFFSLPYARPSFFARETMPVVADLCQRLSLQVIDPQDSRSPETPRAAQLVASYARANRDTLAKMELHGYASDLIRLPQTFADAWWEYSVARDSLERSVPEDVAVPSLFLFYSKYSKRAVTASTWTDCNAQLFPVSDFVALIRPTSRWFGLRKGVQFGFAPYRDVIAALSPMLSDVVTPEGPVPALRDSMRSGARKAFATLPIRLLDGYERILPDGFTDAEAGTPPNKAESARQG